MLCDEPRRRGFLQGDGPPVRHLPQEITDLIINCLDVIDTNDRAHCIKALRLVCRTFYEGLRARTMQQLANQEFQFFLDDMGVNDIERLAKSETAALVTSIALIDRVPFPHRLIYRETDEAQRRARQYPRTTLNAYERDIAIRHARQLSDFDARFPGWRVQWVDSSCTYMLCLDASLSATTLQRLVAAIGRFRNLSSISTRKHEVIEVSAVNLAGEIVDTAILHGKQMIIRGAPSDVIPCDCIASDPKGLGPATGCAMKLDNIVWPSVLELGRLGPLSLHDLPLFNTLTDLKLQFYDKTTIAKTTSLMYDSTTNVANFISRCWALEGLTLKATSTSCFLDRRARDFVPFIADVVLHLARNKVHLHYLEWLEIDHIDPADISMISWLRLHVNSLSYIKFPSCDRFGPADNFWYKGWWEILRLLAITPGLELVKIKFMGFSYTEAEDQLCEALSQTYRVNIVPDVDLRDWLKRTAASLNGWDGKTWALIETAQKGLTDRELKSRGLYDELVEKHPWLEFY